jgi:hypothetical protein
MNADYEIFTGRLNWRDRCAVLGEITLGMIGLLLSGVLRIKFRVEEEDAQ